MYNTATNVTNTTSIQYFMNDPLYVPQNMVNGILNRAGFVGQDPTPLVVGASNVTGQFSENSAATGYPDFYVTLNNYFPDLVTLQRYGSQITFTLSNTTNTTNTYTFVAQNISNISGNLYRIFNTGLTKTTNTFVGGQSCSIRYNYSPVQYISTSAFYSESTFVGPNGPNSPDPATFLNIAGLALTSRMDPVSTFTFYNVSNAPIQPTDVGGMAMNASLVYNNITYGSTLRTTADLSQIFRF